MGKDSKPGPKPADRDAIGAGERLNRRVLIMLPPGLDAAMRAAADRSGHAYSAWVRDAVRLRLWREEEGSVAETSAKLARVPEVGTGPLEERFRR
jgi:hypothetical protein